MRSLSSHLMRQASASDWSPIRGTGYLCAYPLAVIEAIVYRTLSAMVFYINQRYYEHLFSLFDSSSFARIWAYTALTCDHFFQFSLGIKEKDIPITEVFARFATSYPLHNPSDDQFTLWIKTLSTTSSNTQAIGLRNSLPQLKYLIDKLNPNTRKENCGLLFSLILENFCVHNIRESEQSTIASLVKDNYTIFSDWFIRECPKENNTKKENFLRFLAKFSNFNALIESNENLEKFLNLISLFQGNMTENSEWILTNLAQNLRSPSQRKIALPFLLKEFPWRRMPQAIIPQIRKWSKEEPSSETYKIIIERVPHPRTTDTDPVQMEASHLLRKEFSYQEKDRPQPKTSAFVQPLIDAEQKRWQDLLEAQHLLEANFVLDVASGDPLAYNKFIETFPDGIPEFNSEKAISICRICIKDPLIPYQRTLILIFLMCMKTTKTPEDTSEVKNFFKQIFLDHSKSKASDYAFLYRSLLRENNAKKNDILDMIASTIERIDFQSREDWISFGELIEEAKDLKIPPEAKEEILKGIRKQLDPDDRLLLPQKETQSINLFEFLADFFTLPNAEDVKYEEALIGLRNKIASSC